MAIRTFTTQERYSRNKEGVEEPRKKLKKLKSVKVANLDRLRLSMRKEKSRFDRSSVASSNDATNPSGASSTPMSGTSSPNYMKATSSSARKGSSSQGNLGTVLFSSASSNSSDARDSVRNNNFHTTTSKFNREVIRTQKSLKRVPSVKYVKKLSSMKSLKIRAKYSQFQENSSIDVCDQESIVRGGDNQKCVVDRSRTIKLTRLRSKRYPRVSKSRLYGADEKLSSGEPHYMKGTNSHEVKKNSVKGLTRTTSWRPRKILAKVPSLKPRKSKVKKRPQVIPLSRTGLDRATCSSTLKRSEFPDHIELHSGERESHGTSSIHVCPYNYCSLNGHQHHHAPSLPLKEFISTPTRFQSYESEAIKLVQEAVNELLTLPEQASDNRSILSSTTSEQAIPYQVQDRETSSPIAPQTDALVDVTASLKDEKAPPKQSLPSTNNKLSRVIMCKRFIKAMSEMRQLKIQPQEKSCSTQTEAKESPSLRQTVSGEKKSWEEGMLDHALQQVVGKLAPAQKKRVALLVRAFETVGSQQ